jgi:hypothetical protein
MAYDAMLRQLFRLGTMLLLPFFLGLLSRSTGHAFPWHAQLTMWRYAKASFALLLIFRHSRVAFCPHPAAFEEIPHWGLLPTRLYHVSMCHISRAIW